MQGHHVMNLLDPIFLALMIELHHNRRNSMVLSFMRHGFYSRKKCVHVRNVCHFQDFCSVFCARSLKVVLALSTIFLFFRPG